MEIDIEQIMAAYDRKIAALTRQLVFAEAQLAALTTVPPLPAPEQQAPEPDGDPQA